MAQPGPYSTADRTSYVASGVDVVFRWTSGATGAVASVDRKGDNAATPVARTAAGSFTLALAQVYFDHEPMLEEIVQASYSANGAVYVVPIAYNLASKTVTVKTVNAAGAATDPTTGDVVQVTLRLQLYKNV